jgi:hypothetical protein
MRYIIRRFRIFGPKRAVIAVGLIVGSILTATVAMADPALRQCGRRLRRDDGATPSGRHRHGAWPRQVQRNNDSEIDASCQQRQSAVRGPFQEIAAVACASSAGNRADARHRPPGATGAALAALGLSLPRDRSPG